MSDKKRTSITLDEEVYEFLQQNEINQSGLINELVKKYRTNESRDIAALTEQRDRLLDEADELEGRAQSKRERASNITEMIDEAKNKESAQIRQAKDALCETPKEVGNPAIEKWANELGISQQELVEELD